MNIEISSRPILIYGYGNPGRQDDGLGPALVEELEAWAQAEGLAGLVFDSNYQLNAEDALAVAESQAIVFVDAAQAGSAPFEFRPLAPQNEIAFSTHAMSPESVLALAEELYGAQPPAWLLAIRGESWEPNETPTLAARSHLAAARTFLQAWLRGEGRTGQARPGGI
ncbi:MAG: hydrogenase maturation protease [Kiritimatiellia bacterium]